MPAPDFTSERVLPLLAMTELMMTLLAPATKVPPAPTAVAFWLMVTWVASSTDTV